MPKHLLTTLLLLFILTGCDNSEHDNHSAGAHDHGDSIEHDHSGDDEHVDRSVHIVHFSDKSELFLQYEILVAKRDSVFLAHLTDLNGYTPVPGGFITIKLSGGDAPDELFTGKRPVRPGIHIEVALPQYAGERQLSLHFESPTMTVTHRLGTVTVYPDYASSKNSATRLIPENAIYLEKEAQWQARVAIQQATIKGAQLTLPTSAIYQNSHGHFVHVMNGAEFFEQRIVTTGKSNHGQTAILSGITADDQIVINGNKALLSNEETAPHETTNADVVDSDHHH
jgi:cobalt-zinc-cadmium efflux system membrane fusion protein